MIEALLAGSPTIADFQAIRAAYDNPYSLRPSGLAFLYWAARQSDGSPILDIGSGLTTLVLGAAATFTGAHVHALEESADWKANLEALLVSEGLGNVTVYHAPLVDGVYTRPELPPAFGVLSIDGPQSHVGREVAANLALPWCSGFALMDDPNLYNAIPDDLVSNRIFRPVKDLTVFVAAGPRAGD